MKIFFLTLLSSIFLTFSYAQELSSSVLWKITGNELDTPSYLFGTIHLMCEEDLLVSEKLKNTFDKTSQLVMELDMDDPNVNREMQQYSFNPNQQNISEWLTDVEREMVNEFLMANYNSELSQMGIFRPMILSVMITMKLLPCAKTASWEIEFLKMAAAREIEVVGIESVSQQMGVLDSIPQEVQVQWIVEMVTDLDKYEKEFAELVKIYQEQDIDKIYEFTTRLPEYKKYEDLFIINRNKSWIATLEKEMKKKPSFIAVGAGHLGSEAGLVELLKAKGYTLEPLLTE